ncbi:MAG: hypothetical protein M1816_006625 [Peltula sp. TS41687]|nr:MAG: hypothetical protein M1816_006625 [Peltula sp. TS41687]
MKNQGLQCLRPYLCKSIRRSSPLGKPQYARFYAASAPVVRAEAETQPAPQSHSSEVAERMRELEKTGNVEAYPRIGRDVRSMTCEAFRQRYQSLGSEQSREDEVVTIHGRVYSARVAGSKLVFLDVVQNGQTVQGLCNLRRLLEAGTTAEEFKGFHNLIRRGDIITLTGTPHRTSRGELSVNATELPRLLAPSLHPLPTKLEDLETRIRNRHADLLVNRQMAETLRLRSYIIQCLRDFLLSDGFLEVQTPILAAGSGGAVARSFETAATEFSDKKIELRIAPELWLKRLILGGMDRVFEIGPCFRNEGIDLTHNPEFTTCEFYKSFANLEDLVTMTESLLTQLASHVQALKQTHLQTLPPTTTSFTPPFPRLDFISTIESAIHQALPPLSSATAQPALLGLFSHLSLTPPSSPSLPRLLDRLSQTYLEPLCTQPTFITHHPELLSPLSKSFPHPTRPHQRVAARIELFVSGTELINAYEEENSPFEQRRKFIEQQQRGLFRDGDEENNGGGGGGGVVDESYLQALEWGLPPTGGWGCGVDRLVMLFAGTNRIGDVLAFGGLRNVVGLGR